MFINSMSSSEQQFDHILAIDMYTYMYIYITYHDITIYITVYINII